MRPASFGGGFFLRGEKMDAAIDGTTLRMNAALNRHKQQYERDPYDFYVDPPGCTEALLTREIFIGNVLDPFCGSGNILKAFKARGMEVYGTDIVQRNPEQMEVISWEDFDENAYKIDNIVANPPFRNDKIIGHIEKALRVARHKVAMLLPAPFLYSALSRYGRYPFFVRNPPKSILHIASRPSMPPGRLLADGVLKATGGKEDYFWMVWDRTYSGPTFTDWILLPEAAAKLQKKLAKAHGKDQGGETSAARENGRQEALPLPPKP
jgi:hypothetical protein